MNTKQVFESIRAARRASPIDAGLTTFIVMAVVMFIGFAVMVASHFISACQ